ncbi:MAG: arsenate reductase ArsC [Bacteroidota bacterium]
MIRVLFLCIHNSARSQMAEAYLKHFGGDRFHVESAGLEAGRLNPLAVEVMKEEGIDISGNETTDVMGLLIAGKTFDYVITVCDPTASDRCPVFPGTLKKINWSFPDPSTLSGTHDEKLATTKSVRDKIKEAVKELLNDIGAQE